MYVHKFVDLRFAELILRIFVNLYLILYKTIVFPVRQAKRPGTWELNEILCKVYICIDYSMKGVHAFTLLFAAFFLYFHYRYTITED
jgi:hypothetical protein